VANVCGTRERFCSVLNVNAEGLYRRLIDAWRSPVPPKIVKEGSVKEVVEKPKLSKLPVLTHFEKDTGPYLTSAIIYARSSDRKNENVDFKYGFYCGLIYKPNQTKIVSVYSCLYGSKT
jgi:2,5-furandicarboxylate decarboxylase 1